MRLECRWRYREPGREALGSRKQKEHEGSQEGKKESTREARREGLNSRKEWREVPGKKGRMEASEQQKVEGIQKGNI